VLVLSAAVLVIVIDARDVGLLVVPGARGLTRRLEGREGFLGGGWRAGVSRKDAKFAKGMARGV
jgi:hypothetical protein